MRYQISLVLLSWVTLASVVRCGTQWRTCPPKSEYVLSQDFQITSTPQTRKYTLAVTNTTGAPDGFLREVLAINNQIPGPLIEASGG